MLFKLFSIFTRVAFFSWGVGPASLVHTTRHGCSANARTAGGLGPGRSD